jgi:hypothetical protein
MEEKIENAYYLILTDLNPFQEDSSLYSWQLRKNNIIQVVFNGRQMFVAKSINGTYSQLFKFEQDLIKAYIKNNRLEIKKL